MSGTFPATPAPAAVQLGWIQPALVSRARSGKRQSRRKGTLIWMMSATWPVMSFAEWVPMIAFAVAQDGQFGTFQYVFPGVPGSGLAANGTWAGTPVVDGANQIGTALNIRGLTPSAAGIAKAGDVFKPAGSTKVYMIVADANADGAGKAALAIRGPLIASPADGEAITKSSVPFTFAFTEDQKQFGLTPPIFGAVTHNFAESW
jgi:hypothetical protein